MASCGNSLQWYSVADGLCTAIANGLTSPVARQGVVAGQIAWDSASCGALYVAVSQVYPSLSFPVQMSMPNGNCPPPLLVAEYVVVVTRCSPTINANVGDNFANMVPTLADLDDSAQQVYTDLHDIPILVGQYLQQQVDSDVAENYLIMPATPVGPEGGAVATEMHVLVGMMYG